jgi:hypothetical protein
MMVCLASAIPAVAPAASSFAPSAQRQTADAAGVFMMPAGDLTESLFRTQQREALPRMSPIPDDTLIRLKHLTPEAAVPLTIVEEAKGASAAPEALFSECVTNVATGFAPSDIHGAATPTNLVVVTNVDIGVYSKATCGIISRVALRTFFGGFGIPATETLFDPKVLYDRGSSRCLVTVESRNSTNTDQFLYVAASTSSACTSWRLIRFALSRVSPPTLFCKSAATDFYDYPHIGYNSRRLVVTSNNFRGSSFNNGTVLSIDKLALYGGGTVSGRCFTLPGIGNLAAAAVGDANTSMYILSPGTTAITRLRLDTAGTIGTDALVSTPSISIASAPVPPDAAQPNGQRLDTVDGRFVAQTKQLGGFLWNVRSINVGGFARWQLYKLSTTGTTPLFSFTPTTATCAGADHLFMASVDTNSTAPTALAYVTATRTCPSQGAAGRAAHLIFQGPNASAAGWVFNTVETSATQFSTTGLGTSCNLAPGRGSCRWGDYSSTQIDPATPTRAWGFGQLVTGTTQFNWNTRAGQVGP